MIHRARVDSRTILTYKVGAFTYHAEFHGKGAGRYAIVQPVNPQPGVSDGNIESALVAPATAIGRALLDLARAGGGGVGSLAVVDRGVPIIATVLALLLLMVGYMSRRLPAVAENYSSSLID